MVDEPAEEESSALLAAERQAYHNGFDNIRRVAGQAPSGVVPELR